MNVKAEMAEIDHLLLSMASASASERSRAFWALATRIAYMPNLIPDDRRGTLGLADCKGRLIAEWHVPQSVLDRVN